MTEYRAYQYPGEVSFATKVPGHIVPVQVGPGAGVPGSPARVFVRHDQVTIGVGFQQSLGAGIFGGNGFMLQKVGGVGTAWLELSGELIMKNLAPGEVLRVHPGHVGAFQASVGFQITTVPGIKNRSSAEMESSLRCCRGRARSVCRRCRFRGWRTRLASICLGASPAGGPADRRRIAGRDCGRDAGGGPVRQGSVGQR